MSVVGRGTVSQFHNSSLQIRCWVRYSEKTNLKEFETRWPSQEMCMTVISCWSRVCRANRRFLFYTGYCNTTTQRILFSRLQTAAGVENERRKCKVEEDTIPPSHSAPYDYPRKKTTWMNEWNGHCRKGAEKWNKCDNYYTCVREWVSDTQAR